MKWLDRLDREGEGEVVWLVVWIDELLGGWKLLPPITTEMAIMLL